MLEVKRLKKKYEKKENEAVNNLSFQLIDGHVLGLIGESGAGKTTSLKMLAGLLEPDEGKIFLNGEKLINPKNTLIPGYKEIQMVFQNFELAPNFNVYENIRHPVLYSNVEYRKEQINKVLALCELEYLQKRFPREISGGQQQRVALARALVSEPQVLLLDEPFSNLDKPRRNRFLRLIRKIASETGTSIIFVTHEANDALAVADSLMVMKNGYVVQKGNPKKLYNQPINSYVARFFGEINIFQMDKFKDMFGKDCQQMGNYFGIRPEHVLLDDKKGTIKGEITDSLFFGSHTVLNINTNYGELTVTCSSKHAPSIGKYVSLKINKKEINYFWE